MDSDQKCGCFFLYIKDTLALLFQAWYFNNALHLFFGKKNKFQHVFYSQRPGSYGTVPALN